jgi:tRNA A37 threonylcarbamoyltransferase TsaD
MDTTSNAPKAKLTQSLIMTDGLGNQLTSFGNAEDLLARASNFGFDGAADLSNLANSVSAGASIPAPDVNANPAARWDFILSVMQEQLKHRHHSGRTDELINQ